MGKSLHNGGSIIAVIGCDGAGKTTITSALVAWLGWKLDTHLLYLGEDSLIRTMFIDVTRFLRRFRSKNDGASTASMMTENYQKAYATQRRLVTSVVELSVSISRARKVRRAHMLRHTGSIVIADRFPQAQFAGIYDGPRLALVKTSKWPYAKFRKIERENYEIITRMPPDIVIKLFLPVEEACRRKPDHKQDDIERKAAITERLEFDKSLILEFNASKPLDELILDIKRKLWEVI